MGSVLYRQEYGDWSQRECVLSTASREGEFEEVSEATLEAVPCSMRANVKLANLNAFYKQLHEYFSFRKNRSDESYSCRDAYTFTQKPPVVKAMSELF